ncbi:MAG TPA: AraC family transcriptional regulator [Polyangiaceae bacterium]|nr:AraC family transcriptional regulator [Polyangiaceae bacterium]
MSPVLYQPFPLIGSRRGQLWRYAPEYRRPRHFHNEPELNLVMAGSGSFAAGKVRFEVEAGDLLCWPPGQDHELLQASADFDLFVVGLAAEFSERVLREQNALALAGPTCVRLDPITLSRLRSLCRFPSLGLEPAVIEAHVATFWREAHQRRLAARDRHPVGRRALISLLQHHDLDRLQLARSARGAQSEVSRQFHEHTGLTLTQYRTRLRLLAFIRCVDAGSTLLSAAMQAGFGSYSQCHRTFSTAFGCTPRKFFGSQLRIDMSDAFATRPGRA